MAAQPARRLRNALARSRPAHDLQASIESTRMAINDPHVAALEYRIEHVPDVIDWSRADPLDKEENGFRVRAENGRVRFEFKEHYPSMAFVRHRVMRRCQKGAEFLSGHLTRKS